MVDLANGPKLFGCSLITREPWLLSLGQGRGVRRRIFALWCIRGFGSNAGLLVVGDIVRFRGEFDNWDLCDAAALFGQ